MVMSPEGQAMTEKLLSDHGLPTDLSLVVFGRGGTRHVAASARDSRLTWCNLFWRAKELRAADREDDATKKLCGGCLRTQDALEARLRMEDLERA